MNLIYVLAILQCMDMYGMILLDAICCPALVYCSTVPVNWWLVCLVLSCAALSLSFRNCGQAAGWSCRLPQLRNESESAARALLKC